MGDYLGWGLGGLGLLGMTGALGKNFQKFAPMAAIGGAGLGMYNSFNNGGFNSSTFGNIGDSISKGIDYIGKNKEGLGTLMTGLGTLGQIGGGIYQANLAKKAMNDARNDANRRYDDTRADKKRQEDALANGAKAVWGY